MDAAKDQEKFDQSIINDLTTVPSEAAGQVQDVFKVYRRRFIGLVELALLNLTVAWNWSAFAPVAGQAMEHFGTSLAVINWFATSFLLACVFGNIPAALALRRGSKFSMCCCAALMGAGVWIKYAGTRINNVGLAMFGQCLLGFSQPFVINAPICYAQEWFPTTSQATATAVAFFTSPFGSVLASLVSPQWITSASTVTPATLWLSIITTGSCIGAPFIPSRPPTPPSAMETTTEKTAVWQELKKLNKIPEFHIIFWMFTLQLSLFNTLATVQWMLLAPYGFSDSSIGLAGALIIVVGLASSLIMSPTADRFGCHLIMVKIGACFTAAMTLTFVWVPSSKNTAFCYGISALLSISTVGLTAIAETFISYVIYPANLPLAISIMWGGGEALSVALITAASYMTDKNGTYQPAIYFLAAMAFLPVPLAMSLGMFGRKHAVQVKRPEGMESVDVGKA